MQHLELVSSVSITVSSKKRETQSRPNIEQGAFKDPVLEYEVLR